MTTMSGHTSAILASKVKGTAVYNASGDRIGTLAKGRAEKSILDRHHAGQQAVADTLFQQADFELRQFIGTVIHLPRQPLDFGL